MTFFDCTADLVGQLNVNGQKGMLQIDAPPVDNFWLCRWWAVKLRCNKIVTFLTGVPANAGCFV